MRRKIDKKPLQVSITRDPKKLSAASQPKFLILDSIDTLKPDDWARVVAVFATGQEWQFKRWKWSKPVDIFSNGTYYFM
jgi:parafibromin